MPPAYVTMLYDWNVAVFFPVSSEEVKHGGWECTIWEFLGCCLGLLMKWADALADKFDCNSSEKESK